MKLKKTSVIKQSREEPELELKEKQRDGEEKSLFGMKLKKTSVVKQSWEEPELEKVTLKHHQFETLPEKEQVN